MQQSGPLNPRISPTNYLTVEACSFLSAPQKKIGCSKWWRFKYRVDGKEKLLSFGTYPEISLLSAREKRDAARKLVAEGIDPGQERKANKASESGAGTFEAVAREWHSKFSSGWAESHSTKLLRRLELYIFPWIGARPVANIEAHEVLSTIRRIEDKGNLETARRALQVCGQVMRYAVQTLRAERDCTVDVVGAIPTPTQKHMASITDPLQVGNLMLAIQSYPGSFVTRCALQLAPPRVSPAWRASQSRMVRV